jgi:hypothetical protein
MQWNTIASGTDYLSLTPGKAGTPFSITTTGSANAALTIASLGSGNLTLTPGATGKVSISSGNLDIADGTKALQLGGANILTYPNSGADSTSLAVGSGVLTSTTTIALGNTGVGYQTLQRTTTLANTGVGYHAGQNLTSGAANTFMGFEAGLADSTTPLTGNSNTGFGAESLQKLTGTAAANTAFGRQTGNQITTGSSNLILGPLVASTTLATGSNNILIGTGATVDTPLTNTSNYLNIGGLLIGDMSSVNVGIGMEAQLGTILDLSAGSSASNSSLLLPGGTTAARPQCDNCQPLHLR